MSDAFSPMLRRLPLSTVKTATYAAMHFCVAAAVAHLLTGSLGAALSIGLGEPFVQTFFYDAHERIGARVAAPPQALPRPAC